MNKYIIMLAHAVVLASILTFSHGILKWVSSQAHSDYLQLLVSQWKYVLIALSMYGVVFFYYILVLRGSPISTLYPVYTGLSVLLVMLAGRLVFQEVISPYQVLGAAFILTGIVVTGINA